MLAFPENICKGISRAAIKQIPTFRAGRTAGMFGHSFLNTCAGSGSISDVSKNAADTGKSHSTPNSSLTMHTKSSKKYFVCQKEDLCGECTPVSNNLRSLQLRTRQRQSDPRGLKKGVWWPRGAPAGRHVTAHCRGHGPTRFPLGNPGPC